MFSYVVKVINMVRFSDAINGFGTKTHSFDHILQRGAQSKLIWRVAWLVGAGFFLAGCDFSGAGRFTFVSGIRF
jgi:hypothetical protein